MLFLKLFRIMVNELAFFWAILFYFSPFYICLFIMQKLSKDFEKKSPAQIYNPVQLSTFTSGNFARIAEADFHVQSHAVR